MRCSGCGAENPAYARFCGTCGAACESVCASCQTPNPATNRFCHQCGTALVAAPAPRPGVPEAYTPKHLAEKILRSRAAIEGERKQVTVLFVDVSGFTSLAERLDPEDVHALMTRAFDVMLGQVHRYEGTVNQFLGDGIMALFGAPVAHEDHARRAVLAALGIRSALSAFADELRQTRRIEFQVRQGLNTGPVVVGSIGSDLRMDYTAVGDTTNVAARLLQAAPPGHILVSGATHRLVAGHVATRASGELALKGKSDVVSAWAIEHTLDDRHRQSLDAQRGLTPFLGRTRELDVLVDAVERARLGRGHVVGLSGESGIGKSRLLHELHRRCGDQVDWRAAHSLSFGRSMPLHPVIDLVRRACDLHAGDPERVAAGKIDAALRESGVELTRVRPYVRALLSLNPEDAAVGAMEPRRLRAETFDALRRWLVHAGERRPQVVVFEDLQWADQATGSFLAYLADAVASCRLLLVLVHRPDHVLPLRDRADVTTVSLDPLSRDDTTALVRAVVEARPVSSEIEQLIATKAGGNPFYAEELAKTFRETGTVQAVPGTIQDVIAARIDRLDDDLKRVLQVAAVAGRQFTRRIVERLVDAPARVSDMLRELVRAEVLVESRAGGEPGYAFAHTLTHDVVYGSMLVQRRRELHARAGATIETVHAERLAEHCEVLAHHYSRAEQWDRAFDPLVQSGARAARAFALREALAWYDDAVAAAGRCGDAIPAGARLGVHRARVDLRFALGDYEGSRAEADALVVLAQSVGDRAAEANALVQSAVATQWAQDFPGALQQAERAIVLAQAADAADAMAGGLLVSGFIHGVTGRVDEGREYLQRALPFARSVNNPGQLGVMLWFSGALDIWQGRYGEALARAAEGIRIGREHQLVVPLIRCLWTDVAARAGLGDHQGAIGISRETLALAERIGDEAFYTRFLNTLAWLHIDCGDVETGAHLNEQCRAISRRSRHATFVERVAFTLVNDADGFLARGDLALAAEALAEVHAIVESPPPSRWMTWRYALHGQVTSGELALAREDLPAAERWARAALGLAESTQSRKYEARAHRVLGAVATLTRHWDDAGRHLARALEVAAGIGEPRQVWKSHVALAQLHRARKDAEAERVSYDAAYGAVRRVAATLTEPALRAGLARLPEVDLILRELRGTL